jgi:hypothetical protein
MPGTVPAILRRDSPYPKPCVTRWGGSPLSVLNAEIEPRLGEKEGQEMLLLVLLAILALIAFGVGFVVHWLFIVAIVLAIIWVISLFTGGFGRTGARRW